MPFEDGGEDIVGGTIAGLGGRTKRLVRASDPLDDHFFQQIFLAADVVDRRSREEHVATRLIEVAKKGIQRGDRSTRLCRVRVLSDAVPHIHAHRTVMGEKLSGLPDLSGWDPRDRL